MLSQCLQFDFDHIYLG